MIPSRALLLGVLAISMIAGMAGTHAHAQSVTGTIQAINGPPVTPDITTSARTGSQAEVSFANVSDPNDDPLEITILFTGSGTSVPQGSDPFEDVFSVSSTSDSMIIVVRICDDVDPEFILTDDGKERECSNEQISNTAMTIDPGTDTLTFANPQTPTDPISIQFRPTSDVVVGDYVLRYTATEVGGGKN